jgi:hypothetical protein
VLRPRRRLRISRSFDVHRAGTSQFLATQLTACLQNNAALDYHRPIIVSKRYASKAPASRRYPVGNHPADQNIRQNVLLDDLESRVCPEAVTQSTATALCSAIDWLSLRGRVDPTRPVAALPAIQSPKRTNNETHQVIIETSLHGNIVSCSETWYLQANGLCCEVGPSSKTWENEGY